MTRPILRLALLIATALALTVALLPTSPAAAGVAAITGQVVGLDANPVAFAPVVVRARNPVSSNWEIIGSTSADGNGAFSLPAETLPDGLFRLNGMPLATDSSSAPSASVAVEVVDGLAIRPDGPVTLQLNTPIASLSGVVARPGNVTEPDATVVVSRFVSSQETWETVTEVQADGQGRYALALAGLPDDELVISALPAPTTADLLPSFPIPFEVLGGQLVSIAGGPPTPVLTLALVDDAMPTATPTATATATPQPPPVSTQRVVVAVTRAAATPVSGAEVYLFSGDTGDVLDSGLTDAAGVLTFADVGPGAYTLLAFPPAELSGRAWPSLETPLSVPADVGPPIGVSLSLREPALTGTVKQPDGEGVAGALVTVLTLDGQAAGFALTDEGGAFAIGPDDLSPGDYVVSSDTGPLTAFRAPLDEPVTIAEGTTATVELRLRAALKVIAGQVTRGGDPVAGALVYAFGVDSFGYAEAATGADGSYRLPLSEGGAWFVGVAPGTATNFWYPGDEQLVRFNFGEGAETATLNFVGQGLNTRVEGRLDLNGAPPPGTNTVLLSGVDGRIYGGQAGPDGTFAVPVPPGTYALAVDSEDPALDFVPPAPVVVRADAVTTLPEPVRLERLTARIEGRLTVAGESRQGAPVPADGVAVVATGADGWTRQATTGANGSYTIYVRPGPWLVTAAPASGVSPADTYMLSTSQAVNVPADGTAAAPLNVRRADREVSGTLFSSDPRVDVSRLSGTISALGDSGAVVASAPLEEGRYALSLPAGAYVLVVEFPVGFNFLVAPQAADLSQAQQLRKDLPVALASGLVVGRVLSGEAPARGLDATVTAIGEGGRREARVGTNGYYSLALPPGNWTLSVRIGPRSAAGFHLPRELNPNLDVLVRDGETEVLADVQSFVVAPRGHELTGVARAGGQAVAGASVRAADASGFTVQEVRTGPDGAYALALPAGSYTLHVTSANPAHLAVASNLTLTGASGRHVRDVALRAADTTISGVVSGPGAAGALVSATSAGGAVAQVRAAADGTFSFPAVSGEEWRVWAVGLVERSVAGATATDAHQSPHVLVTVPPAGASAVAVPLSAAGVRLPAPVTRSVNADELNILQLGDGARAVIPPFALAPRGRVTVSFGPTVEIPPRAGWVPQVYGYRLSAADPGGPPISRFRADISVLLPLADGPAVSPAQTPALAASSTRSGARTESTRSSANQRGRPPRTRPIVLDPALARSALVASSSAVAADPEEGDVLLVVAADPGLFGVQINLQPADARRTIYLPVVRR